MKFEERFIVQDLETHDFIYPDPSVMWVYSKY
ncbi:hypothetical protein NMEN3081_1618 [Neisseria meningitidis NM3081]|nr:hypothetical protein NMEN3081_1618 [Neisseria meningitidis NM3081]